MIKLDDITEKYISDKMPWIKVREDKVITQTFKSKEKIIIPSKSYPLMNKKRIKVFTETNTSEVKNEIIKKVFNDITFEVGECYANTHVLVNELIKNKINVEPYCGWLIIGAEEPVNHCWCVVEDKYLLDGGNFRNDYKVLDKIEKENINDIATARKMYTDFVKAAMKNENSEERVFGIARREVLYVGTPTSPYEWLKYSQSLMSKYGRDKYYVKGTDNQGFSPLQQEIKKDL